MTFRRRASSYLLSFPAVVALAAAAACAPKIQMVRRPNGILHFQCESSLQVCLNAAEVACEHDRFTVLRAYDQHDWKGSKQQAGSYSPFIEERKSEAFVRCGQHGTFGSDIDVMRKAELCVEPEKTPPPKAHPQQTGIEPAPEPPPVPPKEPVPAPAP